MTSTPNRSIYLTDEQYYSILLKIKETVNAPDFAVRCVDSTTIGDKYTWSNCGFCNDNFTEEETALFPDQFPGRKSMKYRLENHKCPFDLRRKPGILGWGSGCFYRCYVFSHRGKRDWDLDYMKALVDETILWANRL